MFQLVLSTTSIVAVATWSCGKVLGECEFPSDHPDFTPQPSVYAGILDRHRVYEYTDQFGDCSGCVIALNFCYRPASFDNETLFTVEIGGVELSHDVIVHSRTAIGDCESYSADMSDCCIEQVLAEPFTVNHNHHYSLRVPGGTHSILLRHWTEMTNGRIMDLGSGQYFSDSMIPQPLFFFRINTSVSNGQCMSITGYNISTTTMPATVATITTQLPFNDTLFSTSQSVVPSHTPSPAPSSCVPSEGMCAGGQEDSVIIDNIPIIGAIVSVCLLLIIATVVVILVLLCLRRRKVKSELVDNVAYDCHECEIKTDTNAAYHTANNDVITATNAAYGATSVPSTSGENDVDIATSPNEAYISTDIATSVSAAYEPVKNNTLQYDYVPVM